MTAEGRLLQEWPGVLGTMLLLSRRDPRVFSKVTEAHLDLLAGWEEAPVDTIRTFMSSVLRFEERFFGTLEFQGTDIERAVYILVYLARSHEAARGLIEVFVPLLRPGLWDDAFRYKLARTFFDDAGHLLWDVDEVESPDPHEDFDWPGSLNDLSYPERAHLLALAGLPALADPERPEPADWHRGWLNVDWLWDDEEDAGSLPREEDTRSGRSDVMTEASADEEHDHETSRKAVMTESPLAVREAAEPAAAELEEDTRSGRSDVVAEESADGALDRVTPNELLIETLAELLEPAPSESDKSRQDAALIAQIAVAASRAVSRGARSYRSRVGSAPAAVSETVDIGDVLAAEDKRRATLRRTMGEPRLRADTPVGILADFDLLQVMREAGRPVDQLPALLDAAAPPGGWGPPAEGYLDWLDQVEAEVREALEPIRERSESLPWLRDFRGWHPVQTVRVEHRGRWLVVIDLHGLDVALTSEVCEVLFDRPAGEPLLLVFGQGLHSAGGPVLKGEVLRLVEEARQQGRLNVEATKAGSILITPRGESAHE